ncbi:hypothetical protein HAHE_23540 [Haloferula helveola]|uniref:SbsA Ig-like domain-containing protein n=1 Tax=Haloferula helveola TaxID=490095 RepID=A0ABM7RGM7_9BACT|nr:hypothetical protein HAHE_23540 [Haloferula helveola]
MKKLKNHPAALLPIAASIAIAPSVSQGQITPGFDLNYDSRDPASAISSSSWVTTVDDGSGSFDFSFGGDVTLESVSSGASGITNAYRFTGGAGASGTSLDSYTGGPTGQPVTFELWVKPADTASGNPDQVIYETGANGDGCAIFYSVGTPGDGMGTIRWLTKDGEYVTVSADISTADFSHIVCILNQNISGAFDLQEIYVNGALVDDNDSTTVGDDAANDLDHETQDDWAGSDSASMGIGGSGTANSGLSPGNFEGDLSVLRAYFSQALTPAEILANYNEDAGPDTTAPMLTTTDPLDDSTGIYPGTALVATFDEDIELTTSGSITVTDTTDGSGTFSIDLSSLPDPDADISVSGTDLTIIPAASLEFGTAYEVSIDASSIVDLAGSPNAYAGTDAGEWTFVTAAADGTAPTVTAFDPLDGATDFPAANPLSVTFDDPILLEASTPTTVLDEDFESDAGGFTTNGTPNDWAWGTPNSDNAAGLTITAGNSGSNCWATNLGAGGSPSGTIDPLAVSVLQGPDAAGSGLDLTGLASAQVQFAAASDTVTGDVVEVLVKEVGTNTTLVTVPATALAPPLTEDWATYGPFDISDAVGHNVYLEFRYEGSNNTYIGLYIDDLLVTGNSAAAAVTLRNLTTGNDLVIPTSDSSQLSVSGNTLTITPTGGLVVGDDYAVRIGSQVVKNYSDLFFAGIADDTTWNFTTSFTDGDWIADADGNWSDGANWDLGIVADGPGATASFVLDLSGSRTVTLDSDRTIGNLTKQDTLGNNDSLTISGSSTLTLDALGGTPVITNDNTGFGPGFAISAPITGTSGFIKDGPGQVQVTNGSTNYTGDTVINDGMLFLGSIAVANIGGGSGRNITVADGAIVQRNWPAMDNAFLNRLVETTDEIGIFLTATGGSYNTNDLDFSSGGAGADLPNAFLGTWAGNGAKSQYDGTITPAADNYRLGHPQQGGSLHIRSALPDVGGTPRGLIVGGGAVILGAENTFTGDTVLRGGRLFLGRQLAIQNSALNVGNGDGDGITGQICFLNSGGGGLPEIEVTDQPTIGGLIGARNLASIYNSGNQNNTARLAIGSVLGMTLDVDAGKSFEYSGNARLSSTMFLNKTGDGTQALSGNNDYTGATTVSGGTLGLVGGSHASPITVGAGAALGFTLGSPTTSTSTVDLTNGTVKITGAVDNASDYLLMTASGITGVPTLDTPIAGYELQKLAGDTELTLVFVGVGGTPYESWAGGSLFEDDDNGDGVDNGLAFILGAADPNANAVGLLPAPATEPGFLTLTFERLDGIAPAVLSVEYGPDLSFGNTDVIPLTSQTLGSGVEVVVVDGSPTDTVTIKIPDTFESASGTLFGRLSASEN